LIAAQKASSELFTKLENMVVSGVYFKNCKIDSAAMTASISGHASSFEILGQQISKLESSTDILNKVEMGNAVINENGGVDFGVNVQFKEGTAKPRYGG